MLISTTSLPPGGFAYEQPQTKFKPEAYQPFPDVVKAIKEHREANNLPRASFEEVATDLDAYTCQRLGNDSKYCDGGVKKKHFWRQPAQSLAEGARRAGSAVKKLHGGTQILVDWLGAGLEPVAVAVAQNRADLCTGRLSGKPCPHNTHQGLSDITAPVAAFIKSQMDKKAQMRLAVEGESKLETCGICLCVLKLKIYTPMETILGRTSQTMLDEFRTRWPECWMNTETQNPS